MSAPKKVSLSAEWRKNDLDTTRKWLKKWPRDSHRNSIRDCGVTGIAAEGADVSIHVIGKKNDFMVTPRWLQHGWRHAKISVEWAAAHFFYPKCPKFPSAT